MKEILTTILKNFKQSRFTFVLLFYCLCVFVALQFFKNGELVTNETLTYFGAPVAIDIYSFQFWGIITNSFVHYELGHFLLNAVSLLILGTYLERRIGTKNFFLFGLIASTISSAFQLAFSNDAGIGLSGVNYAIFGFIFAKTFLDARFKIVTKNIALIVMTLFIPFCEYMNRYGNWNVATIALFSGFLLGVMIAFYDSVYSKMVKIGLVVLLVLSVVSLLYTPWSPEWNCAKGISFHDKDEIEKAKIYYQKAIYFDETSLCGNDNLKIIKVDELSAKAFTAHNRGDYLKARFFYEEILKIDAENSWAINNLKRLP
ncbi:MAG: rhomboid family intramembrane serine protease [Flavobacteriales bacterium]|nr:rhomboid family intramembrane serine protease [Flavobacteriales bacterium]